MPLVSPIASSSTCIVPKARLTTSVHLKLYHAGTPMPLSDVIPMLENMGLRVIGEEPFEVNYLYGEHTGEIWCTTLHGITQRRED